VVWPSRSACLVGIVGNGAMVAVWAVSRTAGLPIGPEPWTPEAIGALDVVATGLELFIVAVGAWSLSARVEQRGAALA
jgi:hypothetical protein